MLVPGNRVSELSINELFPPIAAEDEEERIIRTRIKFAASPDGVQKEHLMVPCLPEILAKIFNILFYSRPNYLFHPRRNKMEDISKAFDTIPDLVLKSCLARKGVPTSIIELVNNMYNEGKTVIKAKVNY